MEKLQAALKKAREMRANAPVAAGPDLGVNGAAALDARPKTQSPSISSAAQLEKLWDELTPISINKGRLKRRRLLTIDAGREATPFDILRTKVLQVLEAHSWRRIAITSPAPGSGKTTISSNLAASLGRQSDLRIVLMDMDMRRPALAKALVQSGTKSTFDVLERRTSFAEQAVRIGNNLAVSMNHTAMRDPSDLFLRQRTRDVVDEIEDTYKPDVMLFDMPPALVNDDTSAFLKNVDCVLIVVEAGISKIDEVDRCEKELADQTNVLGMVLNKCRHYTGGYGYYNYDGRY
ncbi:MAG: CpsD/CapB family tyrosine-protein kinase [Pseudomonadota bacterium]